MVRLGARVVGALIAIGVALASCAVVLGIEEAHEDSSLTNTSGGGGVAGTDSEGGEGGGGAETPCEEYCREVVSNCDPQGAADPPLRQYADVAQCLAACSLFEVGSVGDRGVNTVDCRLTRARSAQSEPLTDCSAAGPYPGESGCGSNCEAYCTLMMGACTADSTQIEGYYFEDWPSCMAACALVPDTQAYAFHPSPMVITGDHLACRIYHAVVATEGDIEHCEHAMGISLCVP